MQSYTNAASAAQHTNINWYQSFNQNMRIIQCIFQNAKYFVEFAEIQKSSEEENTTSPSIEMQWKFAFSRQNNAADISSEHNSEFEMNYLT